MNILNLFFIRSFVAPKLINVVYWILNIFCLILGLDFITNSPNAVISNLFSLLFIIISLILTRVVVEIMVVPFRIYEKVSLIEKNMLAEEEKYNEENKDLKQAVEE